jgi:tetratricopeptide (TPR) repeat protein
MRTKPEDSGVRGPTNTATQAVQNRYQFDDLTLDVAQRRVARRGRPIELSALNFDLLKVLVESAPNVVTNDELAEKVWGQHFVSPENVAQRVMLLRQSLSDNAAQPRYIERVTDPSELERLAVQNANKALELDAHSAQAYDALGFVDMLHWRWNDALQNSAKAYELAPNSIEALVGYAGMLSLTGNHPEAVRLMERAAQLDPVSPGVRFNLGVVLAQAGRPAAAAAVLRDAAVMAPDAAHIRHWLGHTEARLGNRAAALTELRTAERLSVDSNPTLLTGLLYSYARVDQSEDVARLFARLQARTADGRVSPGTWTLAYLALGESDQALHWLRIAVESIENHEPDAGFINLQTIKTNVHANPILDEPPFLELRERIGALD